MDVGVVSGLLHLATQGRLSRREDFLSKTVASKRPATASGCGGAGPSAASPLLPDAPGIAFVASPCIRPRGARNATHTLFQQPARTGVGPASGNTERLAERLLRAAGTPPAIRRLTEAKIGREMGSVFRNGISGGNQQRLAQ